MKGDFSIYTINSDVLVGKSYSNRGWTLKLDDIKPILPVDKYVRKCSILIDGYTSECRLKINPRLFFRDENLSLYLKKLSEIDSSARVPLEIYVPKDRLFDNFIGKYSHLNQVSYIDMDFKVGKSFSNGEANFPLSVTKLFIPINEYCENYKISVDGFKSEGYLNLLTRIYFSNKKLLNYLRKLYEFEPNQKIHAKILFSNENRDENETKIKISSSILTDKEAMETSFDWDNVFDLVSIDYNSSFKKWVVNHKVDENNSYTRMFSSKSDSMLDAILYLKSLNIVEFE